MTHRLTSLPILFLGTALLVSACSVAPPLTDQETEIKTDLAVNQYMPATRQMRDAIETQELFAQAAFWSNEYDLNPSDLEAAIKLSAAVRKLGNPGRAVEITQTTRALYPRDPYLLAEHGAALIANERSFDAMPILNEGLSIAPAYGRLWSLKGAALDQQEKYAEARQHYDRALRITPNDPNVMANIGLSHALSGDAPTAEQWLRRASTLPGASPSVRQNLILVLKLQGKAEEANRLESLTLKTPQLPTTRPAFSPARVNQSSPTGAIVRQGAVHSSAQPQSRSPFTSRLGNGAPQARLRTNGTSGQGFTSSSEAARAMARKASNTPIASSPKASTAEQQAMLDRVAQNFRANQGPVSQNQASPQNAASHQSYQAYPQSQYLAGEALVATPQRRAPNRTRR